MLKNKHNISPPIHSPEKTKHLSQKKIDKNYRETLAESGNIIFSFKYLDLQDKLLNVKACDTRWFIQLFERKKSYCRMTPQETKQGGDSTRCHSIDWKKTSKKGFNIRNMSEDIEECQLTISLSHGRIIGFFVQNLFYVVWFDPQHKLYS